MDEHLHNDPLEDFFRHSLDDFGDDPSDDVWSNLDKRLALHEGGAAAEGVIPPSANHSSILTNSLIKWGVFAAIVTFLGVFTYHIYQQNSEIANLSEHIDQQTQTIEKLNDKVDNLQNTEGKTVQNLPQKEDSKNAVNPMKNNTLQQVNSIDKNEIAGSQDNVNIANKFQKDSKISPSNSFEGNNLKEKNAFEGNSVAVAKDKGNITNGLQKGSTLNTSKSFGNNDLKEKNPIGRNNIAVTRDKINITNKLQKDSPSNTSKPFDNNNLKEKNNLEKNSIAAAKDKTNITDELQKDLPSNTSKPFEKDLLRGKNNLEENPIAVAKDKTNITDELQKDSPSNTSKPLNKNVLKEEMNATELGSNSNNMDKGDTVLTEILEEEVPPLLTEETEKQENNSLQNTTLPTNNSQTKKEKEAKVKKPKTKRNKLPKTNTPKKKSSLPEGVLAKEAPSKANQEVSAEVVDSESLPEIPSPSNNKKWSIGASFGPSRSFRRVKNKRSKKVAEELNNQEKAAFSYDAGIEVAYHFQKKWSVKSGIQYRQVQQISKLNLRLQCNPKNNGGGPNPEPKTFNCEAKEIKGSFGEIDIDFVLTDESINEGDEVDLTVEHKQALNWLRLPLLVQYTLGNGKLKANLTGGFAANFLLNGTPKFRPIRPKDNRFQHTNTRPQKPQPSTQPSEISKSHLEYVVGLGMSYQTNDKLQLFVEPTYSAALKPVFENKDIETTPFSLSGNIGLRISF